MKRWQMKRWKQIIAVILTAMLFVNGCGAGNSTDAAGSVAGKSANASSADTTNTSGTASSADAANTSAAASTSAASG